MKQISPEISRPRMISSIFEVLMRSFGPQNWWPARTRLEMIIGAILTQNASWSNVEKAIRNLRRANMLRLEALTRAEAGKLAELIRPSGYYNIKAGRIRNFLVYLKQRHNGSLNRMFAWDWPRLRQELLEVNGLGEETVDSILLYAGNKPVFVIDAYTRRVLTRHGLIRGKEPYSALQELFTRSLPADPEIFNEYHALLVKLAKDFCRSRNPICCECPLNKEMTEKTGLPADHSWGCALYPG